MRHVNTFQFHSSSSCSVPGWVHCPTVVLACVAFPWETHPTRTQGMEDHGRTQLSVNGNDPLPEGSDAPGGIEAV